MARGAAGAGSRRAGQAVAQPGTAAAALPDAVADPNSAGPRRQRRRKRLYEITQCAADLPILPGLTTPTWTYGGTFPGPTIVSRSGRRTVIRHHNALPVPVAVHLHGGHTPPDSDGYPLDLIEPQGPKVTPSDGGMAAGMSRNSVVGQREYVYPMQQRAATLWYHDHRMGYTGQAVWRGLAGFHLVHDDEELALPLPKG